MKCTLIASKGSSQWGFRAASTAFPARVPFRLASIPPHCEGTGMGLLRERRRLISIPLAYSLRCAGRACRRQPRLRANKAPFIPRAGLLAAADGLAPARHPADPGARPGRPRTGPDSGGRLWPGRPGLLSQQAPPLGSAETCFHFWARDLRTLSLFSVEILRSLTAHYERRCQFPRPFLWLPTLAPRDGTAQSSQVVRGLCFSS